MNPDLDQLASDYWDYTLSTSPTTALLLGDHRFDSEMEQLSRQAEDEQIETLSRFATTAEAIDDLALTADERVTKAVLIEEASGRVSELRSRAAEFDVSPSWGIHIELPQFAGQFPLTEPEHADAIVEKWSKLGLTFDQMIHRLRQGVARDRTPSATSVEKSVAQIDHYLTTPIKDDPFVNVPAPPTFTPGQTEAWRDQLVAQVVDVIRPAYERYRHELETEVLPKARPQEKAGVRWLPDGEEVYARAIRRHTSLEMAPLDLHNIGLEQIARLADEYREMGVDVLGTSDLTQIHERLRNNPDLRFQTAEQVVLAAEEAMDRARAAIPEWFGRLPQAECIMAEIPEAGAQDAPIAYYLPPATDGSRPGTYFVNTSEPTTRTRFESEALAFHESIPGHHLQLAIAQELNDIPEFRKHALANAYVEGWGLYTERLADEMGLYSGPLPRMGMLSFDSWRSGRLVVDTGMHALGWSKQEAVDFLIANSPLALNNIENEVERYIGMPGQALGYMIGRLEIMRLRDEAARALGSAFDIKAFHDVVLGSGPVPLGVLADLVTTWAS